MNDSGWQRESEQNVENSENSATVECTAVSTANSFTGMRLWDDGLYGEQGWQTDHPRDKCNWQMGFIWPAQR